MGSTGSSGPRGKFQDHITWGHHVNIADFPLYKSKKPLPESMNCRLQSRRKLSWPNEWSECQVSLDSFHYPLYFSNFVINEVDPTLFVCFHGPWKSSNGSSHIFRDLASSPRGIEKGSSLPPVLMVGMNKQIPTSQASSNPYTTITAVIEYH